MASYRHINFDNAEFYSSEYGMVQYVKDYGVNYFGHDRYYMNAASFHLGNTENFPFLEVMPIFEIAKNAEKGVPAPAEFHKFMDDFRAAMGGGPIFVSFIFNDRPILTLSTPAIPLEELTLYLWRKFSLGKRVFQPYEWQLLKDDCIRHQETDDAAIKQAFKLLEMYIEEHMKEHENARIRA